MFIGLVDYMSVGCHKAVDLGSWW